MIVGSGRTGSSWIKLLLESHPQVFATGELFKKKDEARERNSWPFRPIAPGEDHRAYLDEITSTIAPGFTHFGFKLFCRHAQDPPWNQLWDDLANGHAHIIHLRRRNLLAQLISTRTAAHNKIWQLHEGQDRPDEVPLTIEIDDVERFFSRAEAEHGWADDVLASGRKIDLFYEDIAADPESEMQGVLDFLGLPQAQLTTITRVQRQGPKRDVLLNFDELRQRFADRAAAGISPAHWVEFFDDE